MERRGNTGALVVAMLIVGMLLGQAKQAFAWWSSAPGVACATDPYGDNSVSDGWVTASNTSGVSLACPVFENADHPRTSMSSVILRFYDGSSTGSVGTVAVMRDPTSLSTITLGSTASSAGNVGYVAYYVPLPTEWTNAGYAMWTGAIRMGLPVRNGTETRSALYQYDLNW